MMVVVMMVVEEEKEGKKSTETEIELEEAEKNSGSNSGDIEVNVCVWRPKCNLVTGNDNDKQTKWTEGKSSRGWATVVVVVVIER